MNKIRLLLLLAIIFSMNKISRAADNGVEAIPERAILAYMNEKYVSNATINVRKYSRGGDYVFNFWGVNKHPWGNNISVDVIFYEYLHNEYKRSFVELHYKLCDLINKDSFIGVILRQDGKGLKCPMDKGLVGIFNSTIRLPKFPYVFPFQKCKAEIILKAEPSHDVIEKSVLFLIIKDYKNKTGTINAAK